MAINIEEKWLFVGSTILFCTGLFLYVNGNVHMFRPTAFTGVFCLYNLFVRLDNVQTAVFHFIEYIGRSSFDVYLLHYFFFILVNYIDLECPPIISNSQLLTTVTCVAIACVVAYISTLAGKLLHKSNLINQVLFGDIAKSLIKQKQ